MIISPVSRSWSICRTSRCRPDVQPGLAPLTNAVGEIYRYVLDAPSGMPLNEVRAVQDWVIRPALRQVPGVADVDSFGGAIKEYQVRVDPIPAAQVRRDA